MVGQPARVGRGLRTIAVNLSKMAKESATFEAANGKVNISLQKENGEMRSTYEILQQLGEVWGTLNETEQTAIATTIAGKTQFETFANIMKNWGTAAKVVDEATKANGSSLEENAKYLDSIQGKTQAFKSAWEQLSYHLIDSSTIKAVIGFATTLIKGLDKVVEAVGKLPKPLATTIGLLTAFGAIAGGLKLLSIAEGFTAIGKAAKGITGTIEGVGEAANVASGARGLGGLSKALSALTNPAVLGGLAALAVAIAAIEYDKYFSFDSSLKRLNKYQDKLHVVADEIETLRKKRDSGEGLSNAEKTHLAVLEAEERSLRNQIKLEKERVQNAFKTDVNKNQGKRYQERTGPTQLLDYQDARKQEEVLYGKIAEKQKQISDAEVKLQKAREDGDKKMVKRYQNVLDVYNKELSKLDGQQTKLIANTSKASEELGKYWEKISANVNYNDLNKADKKRFDDVHKAFIESQIDASKLKDSYSDVANVINSAMDSLGHKNLNLFDNIDMSSIRTVKDAVNAVKKQIQSLDGDTEITFKIKNADGEIEKVTKKVSELTDKDYEAIVHFNDTGIEKVNDDANKAAENRTSVITAVQEGAEAVSAVIDTASKDRMANVDVTDNNTANKTGKQIDSQANKKRKANVGVTDNGQANQVGNKINSIANRARTAYVNVKEKGASAVQSVINSIKGKSITISITRKITEIFRKKATGKRKGEQGGPAWLGDEGTAQNPKPELVVGEDGAYLAGTGGWELYDLKSTDTVYTAAQTKKLLNGRQKFTIAGNKELPRFAKGTEEIAKDEAMRLVGLVGAGGMSVANAIKAINAISGLDAEEKKDYRAQAYQQVVSYNLKEFQNGKDTRQQILNDIKNYYNTRGKYDATYYEMIEDLRKADQEKEVKRLETLKEKEEDKFNYLKKYAQRQKDYYDKQIDQEEEEAEHLEKLVDLQDKLNNAKKTMVKVYKEGEGFVYEQDVNAVREATKALEEYNKEYNKSDLQKKADEWQAILDVLEDLSDLSEMKELELSLGITDIKQITGGDIGTDINKWTKLAKQILSTKEGYEDLADVLNNAVGTAVEALIGQTLASGNKKVSDSLISQYLSKHSFASGSLNTPSGFSFVGENGPELRYLDKGSAIFSNDVSRNLMEWGQYSPAQVLNSRIGTSQNQTFNFDKIVLPNVRNADDFYKELQQLPNRAIQQSALRM